jgi:hypothetical protein
LALPHVRAPRALLEHAMSSTLAPIADKLGKLIRLLTSDCDGEVIGAARAIKRILDVGGLDIHALAAGIGVPANGEKFSEEEAREIYERGVEDGRRAAEQQQLVTFNGVDESPSWHTIATECAARAERLRPHEKDFVMVRWCVHGGRPTEKQAKWLRAIYVRVRR